MSMKVPKRCVCRFVTGNALGPELGVQVVGILASDRYSG
jgi:hypothetical protein